MAFSSCLTSPGQLWDSRKERVFQRDAGRGHIFDAADLVHEVASQESNVAGTLAQGRRSDGNYVQAVVEILVEFAFADALSEVAIGCGDEADVDAYIFRTAYPLKFALLQNAQELGLDLERQLPDFIQKERGAVGLLETADALLDGAGEGALHVSE